MTRKSNESAEAAINSALNLTTIDFSKFLLRIWQNRRNRKPKRGWKEKKIIGKRGNPILAPQVHG